MTDRRAGLVFGVLVRRRRPGTRCALVAVALALGAVACAVGLVGCAPAAVSTLGPIGTASIGTGASSSPGPSASDVVSPVVGVLTHIDATGLSQVGGFTLRTGDGREVAFRIGILENGSVFPPGHLAEHLASSAPVRVYFRRDGADLVVYRLEDAS